jgi:hypothetical protein
MLLIASSCFDCLSAGPVKRIGLCPKSRRRRAIEAAELLHLRTLGQNRREIEMLTEIFLLHLEATARVAKEAAVTGSNSRFVPITLPTAKAS